jgi:hypothetical protein
LVIATHTQEGRRDGMMATFGLDASSSYLFPIPCMFASRSMVGTIHLIAMDG